MSRHIARWVSPAPLWGRFAAEGEVPGSAPSILADDQARPAILRFASDDFMDQLLAMLDREPARLGELLARPETWRSAMGEAPDLVMREPLPRPVRMLQRLREARRPKGAVLPVAATAEVPEKAQTRTLALKLYQPAHQRYYLVAADLVCATLGFPKRALATGGREQVGFVIRRKLPGLAADGATRALEHAFVKDAGGACWRNAETEDGAATLQPGEELLPLFSMDFRDDTGHPRRLMAGMIPVGRREEYMGTGLDRSAAKGPGSNDPRQAGVASTPLSARKEQFKLEVSEPWKNLLRTAFAVRETILGRTTEDMPGPTRVTTARQFHDQVQMQSWLLLLDFADYLNAHVKSVWDAIDEPPRASPPPLGTPPRRLLDWLEATGLRAALVSVTRPPARKTLEATTALYPDDPGTGLQWPGTTLRLVGLDASYGVIGVHASLAGAAIPAADAADADPGTVPDSPPQPQGKSATLKELQGAQALLDRLVALVSAAVDPATEDTRALPFAAVVQRALGSLPPGDPGEFVIRCAFLRCDCGPLQPPLLSAPTQTFQLASFFDPDAPARPVRIALPLDTTPAGLRKFNKGTALQVSDVLCGQMARAKGLGLVDLVMSVLPWPLHKDLDVQGMGPCKSGGENIGMICSLSIPIVTLCALILLMIIASILDYIFRWMPYLIMCFPVPGLKAKKGP